MSPTRDRLLPPRLAPEPFDHPSAASLRRDRRLAKYAPLHRLRVWCRLVSYWRKARGTPVPASLLMGLAEAECAAALAELAESGAAGEANAAALDAALERVRRRAFDRRTPV